MSLEKAEKYLEEKGFLDHVIELEASTATVTEAASGPSCRAKHDRKDDVFFTGRAGGADSDGRNGESR